MKLIITTLTIIFINFGAYSQVSVEPIVNWQEYPAYVKIGIEKSINEKSCDGLWRAFKTVYDKRKHDPMQVRWLDVSTYISYHLDKLSCK